jgi:hypothetical protein
MELKRDLLHEHRAAIKMSLGSPGYNASGQWTAVNRARDFNPGPLTPRGPAGIFRRIIRESHRVEEDAMRRVQGSNV